MSKNNQFSKMIAFLERLDAAKVTYSMSHTREDSVMISLVVPGQYWEIEFLEDGDVDVERYMSNGHIGGEEMLEELFKYWDEEAPSHDASARE